MPHAASRLITLLAIGALAVVACGGDDPFDLGDVSEADIADGADGGSDTGDESGSDDNDGSPTGPGFGDFISGEITVTGDEEGTYAVDDPTLDFVSGGGCLDGNFGISIQPRAADTGFTVMQLSAEVDADLSGGVTGTYPVEDVALLVVTNTDFGTGPTYRGPGTLVISEHDTGGATGDLNARRMAITIDGSLAGSPSDGGGEVEVSAELVWVMGCP